MYKIEELRAKDRDELLKLISELKGKLLALRFESATGQLNETHLPKETKKDIAKIFTVLKEKELGIEPKTTAKAKSAPKVEEAKEEEVASVDATPEVKDEIVEDQPTTDNEETKEEEA